MISFRNTAYGIVTEQNIKWSDLLTDEVHPNDDGHRIIAELLINFLEDVYSNYYKQEKAIEISYNTLEKSCVLGDKYVNGEILNNKIIKPLDHINILHLKILFLF